MLDVWIAGKGPSLDSFDWSQAGKYRIGINETALLIPDCWGAAAIDLLVLDKYYRSLPKNIIVFKYHKHGIPFEKQFLWDREMVRTQKGTASVILRIMEYLGTQRVHLVGFDSLNNIQGYSQGVKDIKGEGKNQDNYESINEHLREFFSLTPMEIINEAD